MAIGEEEDAGLEFSGTLDVASQYLWRGLTVVNHPVLQPGLTLTFPVRTASLTFGYWSSFEVGEWSKNSALTESDKSNGFTFSEYQPYAEVSVPLGEKLEFTAGAAGYLYPAIDWSPTAELYASAAFDFPLSPTITLYADVVEMQGAYLEMSLSHLISFSDHIGLALGATAGFDLGQDAGFDANGELTRPGNFSSNGFTHAELSASVPIELGSFAIDLGAHVIFAHDAFTRVASATDTDDVKAWFGLTLGWSSPVHFPSWHKR